MEPIVAYSITTYSLKEFIETINDTIITDPHYERPNGCWKNDNKNGFISAQSRGMASSPVVISDIRSMKNYAKSRNLRDYEYYLGLELDGFTGISIDGKHRRVCLKRFVNNEFQFTGILYDLEGIPQYFKSKYFKDIPKDFQTAFLQTPIVLTTYRSCLRSDCAEIARSINSGTPFTAHQLRNTYPCEISAITIDLHEKFKHVIDQMYTDTQISKMQPEETMAKIHMHIVDPQRKLSGKQMDNYYKNGSEKGSGHYDSQATCMLESILEEIKAIYSYNKESLRKCGDQFIYMLIMQTLQTGNQIADYENFIEKAMRLDKKLSVVSIGEYHRQYQNDPLTVESNYYHEQARLNWGPKRGKRFESLFKHLIFENKELFVEQQPAAAK
jgi:hypothetical protein